MRSGIRFIVGWVWIHGEKGLLGRREATTTFEAKLYTMNEE
jgi:hypothetical protein